MDREICNEKIFDFFRILEYVFFKLMSFLVGYDVLYYKKLNVINKLVFYLMYGGYLLINN